MIKSEIRLVCDKCGIETINIEEDILSINPEFYITGFSIHSIEHSGWDVDVDTCECVCPKCK